MKAILQWLFSQHLKSVARRSSRGLEISVPYYDDWMLEQLSNSDLHGLLQDLAHLLTEVQTELKKREL